MAEQSLLNAFDDCTNRLTAGEGLDACLNRYPDLADRLRPMLETVRLVENAGIEPFEMAQARERMRLRVETAARTYTRRKPRRPLWYSLALAAINVTVLCLFGLGVKLATDRIMSKNDSGIVASITPTATETRTAIPTLTNVLVPSPTPSTTASPTLAATDTSTTLPRPTDTATRRATFMTTSTVTSTPTVSRTPTASHTLTATSTHTLRPTATLNQCGVSPAGNYDVRVRSGGGVEYPAIGELLRDQFYPVIGYNEANGRWYAVQFVANAIGWVASSFVQTTSNCDSLPVLTYPPLPTATPGSGSESGNDNGNNNDNQNDNGDDASNDNDGNGHGNGNDDN